MGAAKDLFVQLAFIGTLLLVVKGSDADEACGGSYQPVCADGNCTDPYLPTVGGYCMQPIVQVQQPGCGGFYQPPCPPGVYVHVPATGFPTFPLTSTGCIFSTVVPGWQYVLIPPELKIEGECQDVCIPCGAHGQPVCPGTGKDACTYKQTPENPDGYVVPDPLRPGFCIARSDVTCGVAGKPVCTLPLIVWDSNSDGCLDEAYASDGQCLLCTETTCPPAPTVCEPYKTVAAPSWWVDMQVAINNETAPAIGDCVPCGGAGLPRCDPGENPDPRFSLGCYYFTIPDPAMSLMCMKPDCGGDGQPPCPSLPAELNPTGSGCLPYHNLRSISQTPICHICQKFREDIYLAMSKELGEQATPDIYSRCDDFQYGCGYASRELQGDLKALMVNPVMKDVCIVPGDEGLFSPGAAKQITWPNYWGCNFDCARIGAQCNDPTWDMPLCCVGFGKCKKVGSDPHDISVCVSDCKRFQAAGGNLVCRYDQCGGKDPNGQPWSGPTQCEASTTCTIFSDYYSQCLGLEESALMSPPPPPPPLEPPKEYHFGPTAQTGCRALGQQCGGSSWQGPTCCQGLGKCTQKADYNSVCDSTCPILKEQGEPIVCLYDQCGGLHWASNRQCEPGTECRVRSLYYSQCRFIDPAAEADAEQRAVEDMASSVIAASKCEGDVELMEQCGGKGWTGKTCCKGDGVCAAVSEKYSACFSPCPDLRARGVNLDIQCLYGQCGGEGWAGATQCEPSTECVKKSDAWSECRPIGFEFPKPVSDSSIPEVCSLVSEQCGGEGWSGPTCCQGFAVCLPDAKDKSKSMCVSTCYATREVDSSHNYLCREEMCGGPDYHGRSGAECEPGTECRKDASGLLVCQYPQGSSAGTSAAANVGLFGGSIATIAGVACVVGLLVVSRRTGIWRRRSDAQQVERSHESGAFTDL